MRFGANFVAGKQELLMPVPSLALADYRSFEQIQSGKEGGGPVPFVVVNATFGQTWAKSENRLGAIQRLDLAVPIDAQHSALLGGFRYSSMISLCLTILTEEL